LEATESDALVEELLHFDPSARTIVDLANQRRVVRAVEIYRLTGETPSSRAGTAVAEDVRRYVPEIEFTAVGVDPGSALEERVDLRLARMRASGLIDEVRSLARSMGRNARNAVGYKEILEALSGEVSFDEAFGKAASNTKKLARKQRTWFQRDPRIRWIPWIDDPDQRVRRILEAFD
jgi:tRNA dimethylallyltransferase